MDNAQLRQVLEQGQILFQEEFAQVPREGINLCLADWRGGGEGGVGVEWGEGGS